MVNFLIKFFGYIWSGISTLFLSYFYSIFVTSPFVVVYTAVITFSPLKHPAWIAEHSLLALILVYVPFALVLFLQAVVKVIGARIRAAKKMKESNK